MDVGWDPQGARAPGVGETASGAAALLAPGIGGPGTLPAGAGSSVLPGVLAGVLASALPVATASGVSSASSPSVAS